MDSSEIEELVRAFALCAAFAEEGGFDGVELHGAHGNLIHQFLSPLTNHRMDEYGGRLDNRLRFAMEVVRAVRGRVGQGFVVGMRISGDEFVEGGLDLEQMKEAARRLTAEGQVDYLNVEQQHLFRPGKHGEPHAVHVLPAGTVFAHLGRRSRARRACRCWVWGGINTPELAEKLLAEGKTDLIGMVRELIADPRLPEKAKTGAVEQIRPCIGCMQSCIGRRTKGIHITCIHNPVTGREAIWGQIEAAPGGEVGVGGGWRAGRA